MADEFGITITDHRGKQQERHFNALIDVRDFLGTPGFSLLFTAANTHRSVPDIQRYLDLKSRETPHVGRSLNWLQKKRWLFQKPGTDNTGSSHRVNKDGKDGPALAIMRANPTRSLYQLRALLKESGITRSTEWIRRRRCD